MRRNHLSQSNQSKAEQDFAWLNQPDGNAERYAADAFRDDLEDVARAARMTLVPGYRLVRVKEDASDFAIVLLCDSTQEIAYYIHCHLLQGVVLSGKPLLGVRVWRTGLVKHQQVTSGLAEAIFRLYLLAITDHTDMVSNACDLWGDATGETLLAIISQDVLHNAPASPSSPLRL